MSNEPNTMTPFNREVASREAVEAERLRELLRNTTKPKVVKQHPAEEGSVDKLLTERGAVYGAFQDLASTSQQLKTALSLALNGRLPVKQPLAPDQVEALQMILHKVARIVNGDPNHLDNWDDIAGYATLVADRLRGKIR